MAKYNDNGEEIGDDTKVAIPVRISRAQSWVNDTTRLIRQELSRQADAQGFDTFEEADDFYIEGDDLPRTRYELDDDQLGADAYADSRDKGWFERATRSSPQPDNDPEERVQSKGKGTEKRGKHAKSSKQRSPSHSDGGGSEEADADE